MIGKKNIFVDTNIWIYALTIPHDNLDLENDCDILYSEDMQHNQVIDEKLKIINPFLV